MAIRQISVNKMYYAFHWIEIYPVDSNIHPSNNWGRLWLWLIFAKHLFIYLFIFFFLGGGVGGEGIGGGEKG